MNFTLIVQEAHTLPYTMDMVGDSENSLLDSINGMSGRYGFDSNYINLLPLALIDRDNYRILDFNYVANPDSSQPDLFGYNDSITVTDFALHYRNTTDSSWSESVTSITANDYSSATAAASSNYFDSNTIPHFLYHKDDNTIRRLYYTDSDGWATTTDVSTKVGIQTTGSYWS